jgi:hypothetical protein
MIMSDLYDPETDGSTGDAVPSVKEPCDFCGGKKKVWYGLNGYEFEYPCPKCQER